MLLNTGLKNWMLILFLALGLITSAQSNTDCYFRQTYGGAKADMGGNLALTSDSGTVLVGNTASGGLGGSDGYMMKLNKSGDVIWSKVFGGANEDLLFSVDQAKDGGFIAVGRTRSLGGNANGVGWMFKTDSAGNLQWSRKYDDGKAFGSVFWDVVATADSGFAMCGVTNYTPGLADALVVKTDQLGNVVWSKGFSSGSSDQALGILEDSANLVISAFQYGQGSTFYNGVVMKLTQSSGDFVWSRNYDIDFKSNFFGNIVKSINGYGVTVFNSSDFNLTNPQNVVLSVDTAGFVKSVYKVTSIEDRDGVSIAAATDGSYVITQTDRRVKGGIHVYKVSAAGSLDWTSEIEAPGSQTGANIVQDSDGGYQLVGTTNAEVNEADSANILFVKLNLHGKIPGCNIDEDTAVVSNVGYTFNDNFTWLSVYADSFPSVSSAASTNDFTVQSTTNCTSCALVLPLILTNFSGRTLGDKVELLWSITGESNIAGYEIVKSTDGVKFTKTGETKAAGQHQYSFSETLNAGTKYYYRIKIINRDGSSLFSNVLYFQITKKGSFKVFPNPVVKGPAQLYLPAPAGSNAVMTIADAAGKIVHQQAISLNTTSFYFSADNIAAGNYTIIVRDGKSIHAEKIVVIK